MTLICALCIDAFTWSTSGMGHGSCSTVHGPMFPESTAEEEMGRNPASHQESTEIQGRQEGLGARHQK